MVMASKEIKRLQEVAASSPVRNQKGTVQKAEVRRREALMHSCRHCKKGSVSS